MGTRPEDIHPEHDRPTPSNIDEWSDEQVEAFREAKEADLEAEAQQNRSQLAREQRETLSVLESATDDSDEELTATVELGEAEVLVSKRITGELERKIDRITDEAQSDVPKLSNISDELIDCITTLIIDDTEPDGDRYDFTSPEVWRAYYDKNGSAALFDVFETVADPAMERMEDIKFRGEERRGGSGGRRR